MLILICVAALCPVAPAAAVAAFDPYQVILDRRPFGEPAISGADAAAAAAAAAALAAAGGKTFIDDFRLSSIRQGLDGTRVWLVHLAAKPHPRSFSLGVGEANEKYEIELLDVDYASETALLRHGVEEMEIKLGKAGRGEKAKTGGLPAGKSPGSGTRLSYTERRQRRQAEREAKKKKEEALEARRMMTYEEKVKEFREKQMERIRAGGAKGPVLPIPITKEMDDKLVEEGVLPAQE